MLQDIIKLLSEDRILAHEFLFRQRHTSVTPEFHREMTEAMHELDKLLVLAFRGGGKTTKAEETMIVGSLLGEFRNGIIICSSEAIAGERILSIRSEFQNNDQILTIFGDMRGEIWSDTKLVLSNGVAIQGKGRGQAMRGTKHLQQRPDFWFFDDIEDEDSVESHELREKTKRWFYRVVLPASDAKYKAIMAANLVHPECLAMTVAKDATWAKREYPIEYPGVSGERVATWPDRFPLDWIDREKGGLYQSGQLHTWDQEFMLVADSEESRTFQSHHFRFDERIIRTWQATYAFFDPARTVKKTSAMTGLAVWSWSGPRLTVWECTGDMMMPDQIIANIFRVAETYHPVTIYVEEDGLNEWLMQPIRAEMVRRLAVLPIEAARAPRSKLDFIRGLYPFFNANEVSFAGVETSFSEAKRQFLGFPKGRIDAPNALAYAPRLRAGEPIYPDFGNDNIFEGDDRVGFRNHIFYLALNFDGNWCTGVLCQNLPGQGGRTTILADFVEEGFINQSVKEVVRQASLVASSQVRIVVPSNHYDKYRNLGLVQALSAVPVGCSSGSLPHTGRSQLTDLLRQRSRGQPSILCASMAHWTLNAFSGGYARKVIPGGGLASEPNKGIYRTLMEGLESFIGLMRLGGVDDEGLNERHTRTGRDGRQYVSALRS